MLHIFIIASDHAVCFVSDILNNVQITLCTKKCIYSNTKNTGIKNQNMNLNNSDITQVATMVYGVLYGAPRMHCSMNHITVVETHTLILDVCVFIWCKSVEHLFESLNILLSQLNAKTYIIHTLKCGNPVYFQNEEIVDKINTDPTLPSHSLLNSKILSLNSKI